MPAATKRKLKAPATPPEPTVAERLQFECRAVKLSFSEMGRQKVLSEEHRAEIATSLGANQDSLSLSKRLFDSKEAAIKELNASKSAIHGYWLGLTLPFTEAGTRLIREKDIERFSSHIEELTKNFYSAVKKLDEALPGIIERERQRLGRAFNGTDYPDSVQNLFKVTVSYLNTSPPDYLKKLKPELYERELQRVRAQFEQAAQLAEADMLTQFHNVVAQLVESLQNVSAGKQKTFRSSTVDGLFNVFEQFERNLGSFGLGAGSRLHALVEQARSVVSGTPADLLPDNLRKSQPFRDQVATAMQSVNQELAKCIEERPELRRRVSRTDTV